MAAIDERGAAVVEFALAAPLVLGLLSGIITYGGWFWTAHEVQQAANEAARATLAGLDADERDAIATTAVTSTLAAVGTLNPQRADVDVTETSEMVTVRVTYDMRDSPFAALGLIPAPSPTVRRAATVHLDPA